MRWTLELGSLPTVRSRYSARPPSGSLLPASSATNAGRSAVSVGDVQVDGTPVTPKALSLSMHFTARSRKMSSVLFRVVVPGT